MRSTHSICKCAVMLDLYLRDGMRDVIFIPSKSWIPLCHSFNQIPANSIFLFQFDLNDYFIT